MFLGKIRNKLTRFEKERIENNAARAAAIERHKKKGKRLGKTDIIIPDAKEKKTYTQKEWNKFGKHQKDILTNRYDVILPDYQTRKEKVIKTAKQINLKNFDTVMTKFDKGQKRFWSEFDRGFSDAGLGKKASIYPKKDKKTESDNTTAIFGHTSKKKVSKRSKKNREQKSSNTATIFGIRKSKSKDRVF